ncbi:Spo0E family sporulation regulatory protein-aspartic acid phosphatase [Neobacillus sp. D3-1R]|uniref:Spo0E family sporulation regulatory protein-aspartic acid phosphatase n=1 Tax=Neobacillus sp. D3-1R TaxID=3445778 RepID=UPI003F9F5695
MKTTLILSPLELRVYIEFLRFDLINTGIKLGLNHDRTVKASQELDYFLYQYQVLTESRELTI